MYTLRKEATLVRLSNNSDLTITKKNTPLEVEKRVLKRITRKILYELV